MAGKGQRFKNVGMMTPKPLIDVLGTPMIKWATKSLSFFDEISPDNIIAIVRNEDVQFHRIGEKLDALFPGIRILIDENPQGAVTTTLVARDYIDSNEPILIMDCDIYFKSKRYEAVIENYRGIDGAIPVFDTEEEKWSFSTFGRDYVIKEIIEKKKVIRQNLSTLANVGFYFFSNGSEFIYHANEILAKGTKMHGEYYISLVIAEMVRSGKTIVAALCDDISNMGTPEDLKKYISSHT